MYGGMDATAAPMAKQMKQLGIKAPMLAGDGVCSPEFIKLPATRPTCDLLDGRRKLSESWQRAKTSSQRYKAKFNAEVQVYSPYSLTEISSSPKRSSVGQGRSCGDHRGDACHRFPG